MHFSLLPLSENLEFRNGKSSPERNDSGEFFVYGSNGIIGKSDQNNSSENTIIIGRVGSYCGSLYYSNIPCWVTDNAIICKSKNRDDRFWYYALLNLNLSRLSSGSGQPLINQGVLQRTVCATPLLEKRRQIAAVLGALDDKIDLNRRTNETLEAMARALFRDWFVDFGPTRAKMAGQTPYLAPEIWELFPDRLDDEGKPEGWSMFPLSSFCSLKKESLSPEKTPEIMFSHFSIPAFDKGGMPDLVYGEQIKSGKYVVPDDSILLSKLNPETPRIWFIPNNHTVHPQICSTEFMVLLPQTRELREFIYCAVSAEPFRDLLKSMVTGTSKSHQRVQPSAVMTIDCVLADRKLPLRFGNVVSSFFSRMEKNMIENQNLVQLRDLLLPKLMSGAIRIHDAEKMVQDAL